MINSYLSTDCKHTAHVGTDSVEEIARLAPKAKALYQAVLKEFVTKPELWDEVMNGKSRLGKRIEPVKAAEEAVSPRCPVHGTPMRKVQGKYGSFWSCHQRNPDGNQCQEKAEEYDPCWRGGQQTSGRPPRTRGNLPTASKPSDPIPSAMSYIRRCGHCREVT